MEVLEAAPKDMQPGMEVRLTGEEASKTGNPVDGVS
jgi:hypothetical protein